MPWASRNLLWMDSTHHSSQYVLDLADGDLAARAKADRNVLHIAAPGDWYSEIQCLAVGKFGTRADEQRCYDYMSGEPAPKAPGTKESFTVTGVPAGAKYFAVRVFDDSVNRSGVSNVAKPRL